jgi:predicted CXXCH cytochrome family protein
MERHSETRLRNHRNNIAETTQAQNRRAAMKTITQIGTPRPPGPSLRRKILVALSAAAVSALVISCVTTVNRIMMAPPHIAGAEFVGTDSCADCHEDVTKGFLMATHSMLKNHEGMNIGCESCHGPGSLHVESGGERHLIVNPRKSPETCFQCHLDKRGEFSLPYSHPVLSGRMSCSDCHNPHHGPAIIGGGTMLASENDTCTTCHKAQQGPFIFEHEATREGCTTCHNPHGTVNRKMLTARNANLCLKCHVQEHRHGEIWIGGAPHGARLRTGTCWTVGCHEAVHGSHVHSSLRF